MYFADGRLGSRQFINDQTSVFVINDWIGKYFVADTSIFKDRKIYNAKAYMVDDDLCASVVVLYDWYPDISDHKIAVVDRVTMVRDENENIVSRLYLVYDGQEGYTICTSADIGYVDLNPGDIIQFNIDQSGKIDLINKLFDVYNHDIGYWNKDGKMETVFSQIVSINRAQGIMSLNVDNGLIYFKHADIYEFDKNLKRAFVISKEYLAPNDYVFVRIYDGEVKEVVRYENYQEYDW